MNHELICAKLTYLDFIYTSLFLILSNILGRSQKVSADKRFSSKNNILSGIRQGSIIIYTAENLYSPN